MQNWIKSLKRYKQFTYKIYNDFCQCNLNLVLRENGYNYIFAIKS